MTEILSVIIISCIAILVLSAFKKPLSFLFRFLISALAGGGCLWAANALGFLVGVNAATLLTVGLLGIPGFLGLLALSIFL